MLDPVGDELFSQFGKTGCVFHIDEMFDVTENYVKLIVSLSFVPTELEVEFLVDEKSDDSGEYSWHFLYLLSDFTVEGGFVVESEFVTQTLDFTFGMGQIGLEDHRDILKMNPGITVIIGLESLKLTVLD